MMQTVPLPSTFEPIALSPPPGLAATAVVPTVRSTRLMKYGEHAYYFMNFGEAKGFRVSLRHADIIRPGFGRFRRACATQGRIPSALSCFLGRYHYGFTFLEQILLMTVPHTVTDLGEGVYLINLWSYFGFIRVDCLARSVTYHMLPDTGDDHVLGSRQWFDPVTRELYALSYSLRDSLERRRDPARPVASRLFKYRLDGGDAEPVWEGPLADFLHEIVLSGDRRHGVVCELGMYLDESRAIIPSKVLVLSLEPDKRKAWVLERFIVAAHAQFDPDDPDVIYFSNHNFQFEHTPLFRLLKRGSYAVTFRGPASIFKYRLTPEGPREIGLFTRPDFFRLTNLHAFRHGGRTVIAAMSFPDEIFLIEAGTMCLLRTITVKEPPAGGGARAMIGTIAPSPDGVNLFVQTSRSFQIIDIATGQSIDTREWGRHHTCANHMLVSSHTAWTVPAPGRPS